MRSIVLDQNHWIYLSRAYFGLSKNPTHRRVLDFLISAVDAGEARLPISFLHLVELLKCGNSERRIRLAQVLDELSRGWYTASWSSVIPIELRRAVALALETDAVPGAPEVFGRGFLYGIAPKLRGELSTQLEFLTFDTMAAFAALPGAIQDLVGNSIEANRRTQNALIGNRNQSDAASIDGQREKLRNEDPDLRYRIKLAEHTIKLRDELALALAEHDLTVRGFLSRGLEFSKHFWSLVPSIHTDYSLSLYRDRQWSRPACPNDFADIGHLVLALPYSSVVVTENFWARAIEETKIAASYGTTVCRNLDELEGVLESWPAAV